MSTKFKKIYSKRDIEEAKTGSAAVSRYYGRKSERRKTMQVRIGIEWHKKLSELCEIEGTKLSFLLDSICRHFFKNYEGSQ